MVPAASWNHLHDGSNPFLQHAFLSGLEHHHCLEGHGWYPCHVLAEAAGELLGALPLYLKTNSVGEFVFDWSWADAYERAGGRYYPKLVSAIPFTPVAGARFLLRPDIDDSQAVLAALSHAAREFALRAGCSGIHILFPDAANRNMTAGILDTAGYLQRSGCQYHWFNSGYVTFADFLAGLTARKRKQIRHERQAVTESGIEIEELSGTGIGPEHWQVFHDFYQSTFYRKWGEPRLTLEFFRSLSRNLPQAALLFLASKDGEYVAGAFAMRGQDTLFGRHWGCNANYRFLHFELCYYRTIDFCIRHGLKKLDAGVQGEHKLSRGFIPVRSWSEHWIADPELRQAVARFLDYEGAAINDYINSLQQHLAYRVA